MSYKAAMSIHACATTHKLPSEAVNSQYGVWKLMVSAQMYLEGAERMSVITIAACAI